MRNNKNMIFLLISLSMLIFPIFMIPSVYSAEIQGTDVPKSSQMLSNPISVAIYDDANTTVPSYAGPVTLTNNHSNIQTALLTAGYEVTLLSTNQIYNHELQTAKYDIFIIADHMPKTNITNFVKEYWLGGGSLLSMDSALSFLCYAGILPPESVGDEGLGTYWYYQSSTIQNITTRHPVSKSYSVDDTFTISNPTLSATIDWAALQGTSIASELVKIATIPGFPNAATVVAYDPQSRGGKVVYIVNHRDLEDDAILIDAIEWLCPRPKGRIAFDLSHIPRLGVDNWDDIAAYPGYYETWRDDLVSRGYLFDKLYPTVSANFTSSRLDPYDMLVIVSPDSDYSTIDRSTVTNWVNNGGGLLVLGENPLLSDFAVTNARINYLLDAFDLELNQSFGIGTTALGLPEEHPIAEGCTDVTMYATGAVNITGSAYNLWDFGSNVIIAGQDSASGRIIVIGDMNWCADGNIATTDNEQFAINVANWLTASKAEVLLYVDEPYSPNYYRTPVSNALNELGIDFYLTFDDYYLNLSLNLYDWKIVIIDNPWKAFSTSVLTTLNEYVKEGGRLLMSTFRVDLIPTHPLWARLGFAFEQEQPGSSSLYIWAATHAIFNVPVDYGAARFDPIRDYGDEGDLLRVYPNATALAGYTATETANNSNIVLGNGGKTLYNGYLIDQFSGDLDDSTYADNFELWVNEIAFMWAQTLPPETPPGIPGYDMFIVLGSIFLVMGLMAVITVKKKHIKH